MALEHNFDVQISRKNPEIDVYGLNSSYGAYDPAFRMTQSEGFNSRPGAFSASTGLTAPSSQVTSDVYSPAIVGGIPTGATYSIGSVNSPLLVRNSGNLIAGYQYATSAGISVTQPLLKNMWTDLTRETIELNKRTLVIDELGFTFQLITSVSAVETAYYELIFSLENVKVQQRALEVAEQLLAENKKRVEVGALAPLDEKQAESQVAASRASLLDAVRGVASAQNALKTLITDDYSTLHETSIVPTETLVAVPESLNLQDCWRTAFTARPDLQQQRQKVEKQNVVLRFTHNQLFPQLDLNATYGQNGLGTSLDSGFSGLQSGKNQFYSYQLTLTIPFSNLAARNTHKQNVALKEQLVLQLKQYEQFVLVDVDNAVETVRSTFQKVEATRDARVYAEDALAAERKKLENGKSTSFVVLQLLSNLTTARSNEIRALADYNEALTTLSQKEGTTLERHKLTVQVVH